MIYDIKLKDAISQPVMSIRLETSRSRLADTIAGILRETQAYAAELGIIPAGRPFTRYYRLNPTEADIEAGLPLFEPMPGRGRIISSELPGGRLAHTCHNGLYDGLFKAYQALEMWMADHGYESAGAPWEIYWTDPGEELDPSLWRTEVVWPVR